MKACTECQRLYPDDAGFCPLDGKGLRAAAEVVIPPNPKDPRIGATLCGGRFQIRRIVADGGMGRVYQALDLQAERSVALKVLHEDVAQDEVAVERFKREFSLSAELPHDYIVEVLDFQKTEDRSYALVMEYLEGEELRMVVKREKVLSPARLLRIVSQLARGLDDAHRRKMVHRDIKPDNIFLCGTADGDRVKLLDFGSVRDNNEGAKKLTVIGTTIGSPYYMAPEQAQGLRELDHRADVWSVAAIAYECLTGTLPFAGKTGPQILLAILSQEPAPPSIAGREHHLPESLDDVMADALAKDMRTRIGSLGELADRLGAAFGLDGTHADWLAVPEEKLLERIEHGPERPPEVRAEPAGYRAPGVPDGAPPGGQGPLPANPPTLNDEDDAVVMGLPQGPPWALLAAIGGTVLLIVALVIYLVVAS